MIKKITKLLFLTTVLALSNGCGSGGDNNSSPSQVASAVKVVPFMDYSPSLETLASRKTGSALTFSSAGSLFSSGQGCTETLTNKTVYEQLHTVVFAANGVSESEQQEVAEFAESNVLELRSKFPVLLETATGLIGNKKIHVCVQVQPINGAANTPAAATPLESVERAASGEPASTGNGFGTGLGISSKFGGLVIVQSAKGFFSAPRLRSAMAADYGQNFQEIYHRVMAHEMTHLVSSALSGIRMDQWFEEGAARYFEFGQSIQTRAEILALVAAQNPVAVGWPADYSNIKIREYSASAAVFSYLFSPTGAHNPLAAYAEMLERTKLEAVADTVRCLKLVNGCPTTATEVEARRSEIFVKAFEAVFREKDGTPMRLRHGPNNLQDTLSTRFASFW
jgi:hypothetical protein